MFSLLSVHPLLAKCCADGHEKDDFDTTTDSMLRLFLDSKGYCVKNPTFYLLDLVCLTSLLSIQENKYMSKLSGQNRQKKQQSEC